MLIKYIIQSLILFHLFVHPITALPWVLGSAFGTFFSGSRLKQFFLSEEIIDTRPPSDSPTEEENKKVVTSALAAKTINIKEGEFYWPGQNESRNAKDGDEAPFALKIPGFSVPRGALVMIVGKCGAGKTAFINSLLKEMIGIDKPAQVLSYNIRVKKN